MVLVVTHGGQMEAKASHEGSHCPYLTIGVHTVNIETILIASRLLIRQELNPLCSFPTTKIVNPRYLILAIEMEFL